MSNPLPERSSLEFLKKLAKDRLQELRRSDPNTKLAAALLAVARDHGFSSWRALKAEVEQRQAKSVARFFEACATGDIGALRVLLANNPGLVGMSKPDAPHGGWTGLHSAAQRGHVDAVRLLLDCGADANAREAGDNTYPLHWAAAEGHAVTVRALLEAGGEAHGIGDAHQLDVIGWATFYFPRDREPGSNREVVRLLLESGARHHIFSAIAVGELQLIQEVVERDPEALDRGLSRFDDGLTPLHYAMDRGRYDILDVLIELGADLEATDKHGHTAMAAAMLRGDREALGRLQAAGAELPKPTRVPKASTAAAAESVRHSAPMIAVPDVARTVEWYKSIGFKEAGRNEDEGLVNWALVSIGRADVMLRLGGTAGPHDVSLWFYTDQVDELYELFKSRKLEAAEASLAGTEAGQEGIEIVQPIYDPFYGGRELGIRDLNGYELYFRWPPGG